MNRVAMVALLLASTLRAADEVSIFSPGVISVAPLSEAGGTFSSDGNELYFVVRTPTTTSLPLSVICVSRRVSGQWSRPVVASFSGRYFDSAPALSPDGSKLFFSSIRPVDGVERTDLDLWVVERSGTGWSEPRNLGVPVNGAGNDQTPSVTADGTLYFASDRAGGKGSQDLYRATFSDGHYQEPQNLGDAINSAASEVTPYVSPDEQVLLFAAAGRPDMLLAGGSPYARADLYVSVREHGAWTAARHLREPVNTVANESFPFLSPDRKWLYFSSERNPFAVPVRATLSFRELVRLQHKLENGRSNIYVVDARSAGIE